MQPLIVLRSDASDELAGLAAQCGLSGRAEEYAALLNQTSVIGLGLVATDETCIAVLLAQMTPDMADIIDLMVHPSLRRQGLAMRLVNALARHAGERGIGRITLDVSAENVAALSLYDKLGFQIDHRRKGYYKNGSDALLLGVETSRLAGLPR